MASGAVGPRQTLGAVSFLLANFTIGGEVNANAGGLIAQAVPVHTLRTIDDATFTEKKTQNTP